MKSSQGKNNEAQRESDSNAPVEPEKGSEIKLPQVNFMDTVQREPDSNAPVESEKASEISSPQVNFMNKVQGEIRREIDSNAFVEHQEGCESVSIRAVGLEESKLIEIINRLGKEEFLQQYRVSLSATPKGAIVWIKEVEKRSGANLDRNTCFFYD